MDRREGIPFPGPGSYYMHQGLEASDSGSQDSQPSLHGQQGIRPLSSYNVNFLTQSSNIHGGSISSTLPGGLQPLISQHGNSNVAGQGGMEQGELVKRKRGRPRKYGPAGSLAFGLSPVSSTPAVQSPVGSWSVSESGSGLPKPKRGRGRPPGSTSKQNPSSLGGLLSSSAGTSFTPHILTVSTGEDIAAKIMSFSHQGPKGLCILSAAGAVSSATLRQPALSGGTVTYEGHFQILSLSGSYVVTDDNKSVVRSGGLTTTLSNSEGRIIAGLIGGMLIAASTVKVIVGSFNYGDTKRKNKSTAGSEQGAETGTTMGDNSVSLPGARTSENPNPLGIDWHGSRQASVRNANIDINSTRG